ncbi:protein-glutamate methylesterase/protein-glutamine glutaminase [Vibrio diabolicus]|uniref:protein-glutamate methylesterase/protein-glutamine glutaminase n=1 Tax=Vibrio diabolicus TaxID=50719 RepID=UPI00373ECA28
MAIKVLVVDDSSFFRRRVSEIINSESRLEVIDVAVNGLPKKFEDIARNREEAVSLLQQRVIQIASKRAFMRRPITRAAASTNAAARPLGSRTASPATPAPARAAAAKFRASGKKYQLTAIGTSTGGPVALQKILTRLPMNYPHPIVLIQHMPATFTAAFASRLNTLCKIQVKEAQDGDVLQPGVAYLAPGGKQMMVDGRAGAARLRIIDGGDRMNYKPCVDVTFGSAAKVYGDKVLSLVLTGMGADGREGARMLKSAGSTIWAQDEESCVVYGMPQAVAKAGISSEDLPLDRIAERMLVEVGLA